MRRWVCWTLAPCMLASLGFGLAFGLLGSALGAILFGFANVLGYAEARKHDP